MCQFQPHQNQHDKKNCDHYLTSINHKVSPHHEAIHGMKGIPLHHISLTAISQEPCIMVTHIEFLPFPVAAVTWHPSQSLSISSYCLMPKMCEVIAKATCMMRSSLWQVQMTLSIIHS
jgi:hypothetical protein